MVKNPKELALHIAEILKDKRAEELLVLEIGHLTVIADAMVIGNGRSMVQVKALADAAEEKLKEEGVYPLRREGYAEGRWIVLDYGAVLVHIFHEQEREYYHLERLWMDGSNSVPLAEG
ncbi:MAG: ribosome silencing factor [Firmicutes bacterium]|nr:ribosome silencing factor [Bacillota bacterium]